ncbi:MAG: hypothetical protein ABIB93_06000 [Chloroflexota bacterium]
MRRFWQRITKGEGGQVLIAVLIALALGAVLVSSCLGYADTSLRSRQAMAKSLKGIYAADAGIEDVLWCLDNDIAIRSSLPQNLNGMQVTMQMEEQGDYTIYAGEMVTPAVHYTWLLVNGEMVWKKMAGAYKFTITVTWDAESSGSIQLFSVGTRLPCGFTYQPASAALFGGNLSTSEPTDELDGSGAHMLNWVFSPPRPTVTESDPTRTQVYYVTGEGDTDEHYSWAVAQSSIGIVSEFSGTFYTITATATNPDDSSTTARIVADVMISPGGTYLTSWKINPEQE